MLWYEAWDVRFPLAVIDENGKIIHKNPSLQEYPVSGYLVFVG